MCRYVYYNLLPPLCQFPLPTVYHTDEIAFKLHLLAHYHQHIPSEGLNLV